MPFISNAVVIGDNKKYLTVLLTIKQNPNDELSISDAALHILKQEGVNVDIVKTIKEAKHDSAVAHLIDEGIRKANEKAISKAHHIKKWVLLDRDFQIDTGEITPTMKLKRNVINKMNIHAIDKLYIDEHANLTTSHSKL